MLSRNQAMHTYPPITELLIVYPRDIAMISNEVEVRGRQESLRV